MGAFAFFARNVESVTPSRTSKSRLSTSRSRRRGPVAPGAAHGGLRCRRPALPSPCRTAGRVRGAGRPPPRCSAGTRVLGYLRVEPVQPPPVQLHARRQRRHLVLERSLFAAAGAWALRRHVHRDDEDPARHVRDRLDRRLQGAFHLPTPRRPEPAERLHLEHRSPVGGHEFSVSAAVTARAIKRPQPRLKLAQQHLDGALSARRVCLLPVQHAPILRPLTDSLDTDMPGSRWPAADTTPAWN